MLVNFIFAFVIFLILRYFVPRTITGDKVTLEQGVIFAIFYACVFVLISEFNKRASYTTHYRLPDSSRVSQKD
jgi:hypothetical protein